MELNKIDQEYVQGIEALLEDGGVISKETLLNDIRKRDAFYKKDKDKDNSLIFFTYLLCQYQASDVIKNLIKIINK